MGVISNRACCCTCLEMFQDFNMGDEVEVSLAGSPGQSERVSGTLNTNVDATTESVLINDIRVCCAFITDVRPGSGGGQ